MIAVIDDFVGGTAFGGIPGSTMQLHQEMTLGPTPNQTGNGSTTSSINWGALTGWSQTGTLRCTTQCSGGCGSASACKPLFGFEGLGPLPPLNSAAFNTDPWVFTGSEFTSNSSFQYSLVNLGELRDFLQIGGRLVAISILPLAALGGLAAGLVYLGARALRRRRA